MLPPLPSTTTFSFKPEPSTALSHLRKHPRNAGELVADLGEGGSEDEGFEAKST